MAKANKTSKKMKVINNQKYRVRKGGKLLKETFFEYEKARQFVRKVLRKEGTSGWRQLGISNPSMRHDNKGVALRIEKAA